MTVATPTVKTKAMKMAIVKVKITDTATAMKTVKKMAITTVVTLTKPTRKDSLCLT